MTPAKKKSIEDRYGPVVLECVSKSQPDREPYRVRMLNGVYSCNCKSWIFCRRKPKYCIHTVKAAMLLVKQVDRTGRVYQTIVVLGSEFPWIAAMTWEQKDRMAQIIQDHCGVTESVQVIQQTTVIRRIVFDD